MFCIVYILLTLLKYSVIGYVVTEAHLTYLPAKALDRIRNMQKPANRYGGAFGEVLAISILILLPYWLTDEVGTLSLIVAGLYAAQAAFIVAAYYGKPLKYKPTYRKLLLLIGICVVTNIVIALYQFIFN